MRRAPSGRAESRADVLGGARDAGVGGVDVERYRVVDVAGDNRTLAKVDVFEGVDQAGDVVEVHQRRGAELAAFAVDHVDGGTAAAEMHFGAPGLEVVARVRAG